MMLFIIMNKVVLTFGSVDQIMFKVVRLMFGQFNDGSIRTVVFFGAIVFSIFC